MACLIILVFASITLRIQFYSFEDLNEFAVESNNETITESWHNFICILCMFYGS